MGKNKEKVDLFHCEICGETLGEHEVEIFGDDEDKHRLSCEIKRKIFHEFTTTRTWVDIEDRDGKKYLIGELYTREIGELD